MSRSHSRHFGWHLALTTSLQTHSNPEVCRTIVTQTCAGGLRKRYMTTRDAASNICWQGCHPCTTCFGTACVGKFATLCTICFGKFASHCRSCFGKSPPLARRVLAMATTHCKTCTHVWAWVVFHLRPRNPLTPMLM